MAERRPPRRRGPVDPARRVAYDLLRAVDAEDAYANLVLPRLLKTGALNGRDAALATELGYGTLRALGTLDEVLARCVDRPLPEVEPGVRDLLRLGGYQALRTRVPLHAAVATTVDLAPAVGHGRAGGFVNAVLRRVSARSWDEWVAELSAGATPLHALAVRTAHPDWIVAAFTAALGGDTEEAERALAADDERPRTHLVAWPGRSTPRRAGRRGSAASPARTRPTRSGWPAATRRRWRPCGSAGPVSRTRAASCAPSRWRPPRSTGRDERWLDLCAGPGGKAALLAALAAGRGGRPDRERAPRTPGRARRPGHRAVGRSRSPSGTRAPSRPGTAATTACSWTRRAPASGRCAGGRKPGGGAGRTTSASWRGCRGSCSARRCASPDPAASSPTSPARRTRPRRSRW